MVSLRHVTSLLFSLLNICLVASSMIEKTNKYHPVSYYWHQLLNRPSTLQRQGAFPIPTHGLVDVLMYGLAGIPVYKAVESILPLLKIKKQQNSRDNGRVINSRNKRSLAFAQQLLSLLISLENALEKYGITEPQCQLRATCEIHQRNANRFSNRVGFERNVIKLVNEMRRQIKNPKVIPMAKYVFEFYEEAAERGEQNLDCKELYDECPYSLDYFYKGTNKGKKTQMSFPPFPGHQQQRVYQ